MFALDIIGGDKSGMAFEVRTRRGAFAGIVTEKVNGAVRVYFNSDATRGSARKFTSIAQALEFIHARRVKKGWAV